MKADCDVREARRGEARGGGRRLHVAQLVPSLGIGGMEVMAATLACHLDRERFASSILCFDALGPLEEEVERQGIEVLLLRRRPGVDLAYPFRLARLLRRCGIDILHAHNATAFFYGTLGARLARVAASVFTEHDREHPDRLRVRWTHRLLSRWVTGTVAVSDGLGRILCRGEGFPASRLRTIHNGIDPAGVPDLSREEASRRLALPPGGPTIGVVAGLKPVKDHPCLLRALVRVRASLPACRLLFVGDGPSRGELEAMVRGLGLGEAVRFLGFRRDVGAVLRACDALALASRSEGFPLSVLEAMAGSLPVVATRVGAVEEAVADGQTGRLVPPGDPEALARALVEVLSDAALARAMGRRARERFLEEFTVEHMVRAYEGLYREIATRARGRRGGRRGGAG